MYEVIYEYFESHGYDFIETKNEDNLKIIHDVVFNERNMYVDATNYELMYYFGIIYHIRIDFYNAKKFLKLACETDDVQVKNEITNILLDMCKKQGDFDEMKMYYLMSIENNKNVDSMLKLAKLLNYEDSKKYYLMAIENKCCVAMHEFANVSLNLFDYKNALKYHLMKITCEDCWNHDHDDYFYFSEIENNDMLSVICGEMCFCKQYDDLLEIYEDYMSNPKTKFHKIIHNIFWERDSIKLNNKSTNILQTYKYNMNNVFEDSEGYDICVFFKFKVFKFTGEIPLRHKFNGNAYETLKIIKKHVMPKRHIIKTPKFIIMEICKWLFK